MHTAFESKEKVYTIEEYLAKEERVKNKHEYYDGKIVPMRSADVIQCMLMANAITSIVKICWEGDYSYSNSDIKIHIPTINSFVCPNGVVVFKETGFYNGRQDVMTNPILIVEVASSSVLEHERSKNFFYYKSLPSLQEYVRIEQHFSWVISSYKSAEHTWVMNEAFGLNESLLLKSISGSIELKDIYHHMKFC